ncbi:hypothetical protein AGRO_3788 [Agrobacterium sp. ATCC 31749]|nr:hypothetical protein AGRO_3788 [Agrobacterium sp. ATCC 31749]
MTGMAKAFISLPVRLSRADHYSNTTRIRWRDWTGARDDV